MRRPKLSLLKRSETSEKKLEVKYCGIDLYILFKAVIPSHLSSLTLTVVGPPQMTLQQYFSTFLCLPLPLGISKPYSCQFFHVVFSSLFLSSSPCCSAPAPYRTLLAMPQDLEMRPYHLSFRFFTMVRRSSSFQLHRESYYRPPHLSHILLYEPRHEKTCLCHMRPAKARISLRIRAV